MKCKENHDSRTDSRVMQLIESLTGGLEGCGLSSEKLSGVQRDLSILAGHLGVSEMQAVFFIAILSQNFKRKYVSVEYLSKYLGCPGITIMKHLPDLEVLQKKRWIRADSEAHRKRSMLNEICFYVVREVFDRLMNGDGKLESAVRKDIFEVLAELMGLALDYDKERTSYYEMRQDVKEVLEANADLPFIELLRQQGLSEEEEFLFMLVCQRTLTGDPDVDLEQVVGIVAGAPSARISLKRSIVREKSKLITGNLLKMQEGMFRTDTEIVLTDRAITLFFPNDADLLIKKSINTSNLLKAESISAVDLFFNREENQVMDGLRKLLTVKGYNGVVKRLKEQGLRRGFTILFHGSPGTGKTEAVYQLARKAGRDVMKVDLSQTKSMWFGESEKKVKEIFNQYRALSSCAHRTPILLFNEADGIFGARRELKDNGASQTFNTMQNILLEELENFEGILIATTNLTGNFDRAFERRFLYKVGFSGPDEHTRARIWRSKIKEMSPKLAQALAQEFSLSGGQIENVTRKFHIDRILQGTGLSHECLASYCRAETLARSENRALGFKQSNIGRAS